MMTRRKSSEQFEAPTQKKLKTNKGTEKVVEPVSNLDQFISDPLTIEMLNKRGITSLFAIQTASFKIIHEGGDLVGQDRTGSGKTLAYCLPVVERLREQGTFPTQKQAKVPKRVLQCLVIVPTRELCLQVSKELSTLKHFQNEFKVHSVYGGTQVSEQITELRQGGEWIIATPGRLQDMINRGVINFDSLKSVILDEADQMLQFGFQEDLEKIFACIAQQRTMSEIQMLMFSATIPPWMKQLTNKYMKANRQHINLINLSESQAASQVTHYALHCAFGQMISSIGDVVAVYGGKHAKTIIFCETKAQANDCMIKAKIPTESQVLHGDIQQKQREITFQAFKTGQFKCLIATNVASRGLDFPEVDLIIQLQPPKEVDTYIHRAGRTARAGKKGVCITFYAKAQQNLMERIERQARIKFIMMNPPQPMDIIKASQRDLMVSLQQVNSDVITLFKPVAEEIGSQMELSEALARALACMSGYKDKIRQRSMLGSFEGYITLQITSNTAFNATSYIRKFMGGILPENMVASIKGMRKLKDTYLQGVVFDFPCQYHEDLKTAFATYMETDRIKNFELTTPTTLPEIEEDAYQVAQNGHQQNQYNQNQQRGRGDGQRGGRGGASKAFEIFVGGLSFDIEEPAINQFFKSQDVNIVGLRMLRDDQNRFKGIAFAQCADEGEVQKALLLNGHKLGQRNLRINMADQKPQGPS